MSTELIMFLIGYLLSTVIDLLIEYIYRDKEKK